MDDETRIVLQKILSVVETTHEDVAVLKTRVETLETRFDGLETRFDKLETRFDKLETKVDTIAQVTSANHFKTVGRIDHLYDTMVDYIINPEQKRRKVE